MGADGYISIWDAEKADEIDKQVGNLTWKSLGSEEECPCGQDLPCSVRLCDHPGIYEYTIFGKRIYLVYRATNYHSGYNRTDYRTWNDAFIDDWQVWT